eukprot:TRINITY_DN5092_c1_g5_i1.p1 TRINITY_DN5092_c1_g5~~TRINITY_DN5092_c1_g5_i1.p1  ORF type:complete len:196 (-),score=26.94 TRINITY_DN5092_c1_g5_i1:93-680(-)
MNSMACGFGFAAARALSRRVPIPGFRATSTSSSAAQCGSKYASMTARSADDERPSVLSTGESLDERILENAVYGDDQERDASSDEDGSVSVREQDDVAARSKTFSSGELPLPSEFMDPEWMASYMKSGFQADGYSSVASSDSENCEDACLAEESDADEMYSGPLQPVRTHARRDFPAPSEYLTSTELLSLVQGFA